MLDVTNDWGEKEQNYINGYEALVDLLMYAALVTQLDMLFGVTALCQYNSHPFRSQLTTAKSVLQYLTFTTDF